jgi:Xaa-Pro aminopeptidase
LHYTANNEDLSPGDLLVVDIGAEYRNYTADITRTIPVSGYYTDEQKEIYQLVLNAQRAAIEECKKGKKFWEPNDVAKQVIQKGLKNLGITKRSFEAKKYFMHGTSHYLGLDVHDLGTYESLKPGHVITVEPGIYIPEGSDCDPKWWNIGIRIEDDILISEEGPIILSDCVPVEIVDIEFLMKSQ